FVLARQVEHVNRASRAHEKRLRAEAVVVNGAGRRGEVEDELDRAGIEGGANVLVEELEARLGAKVSEIGHVTSGEVVDAHDGIPLGQERIGQMRAEETRGPSNKNLLHSLHCFAYLRDGVTRSLRCTG